MIDAAYWIAKKGATMIHQVIGLDVSKETIDLSVYNGKHHKHKILKNSPRQLLHYIKRYDPSSTHVIMESTGVYHLRLAFAATEAGYPVSIVNPLIIKRYGEMKLRRVKTDKADAKLIAEYGYEQKPGLFKPADKERIHLQQILKGLEELYKSRTQMSNRIEAYDHGIGIAPSLRESLSSIIKTIDEEIQKLTDELNDYMDTHYPQLKSTLKSIPGVGDKTASTIIAYYGEFESFSTAKQAASYAGINPNPRQSGTSVNRCSNISKRGHSIIRKALYMCALSLVRCNPEYKAYYESMLARGKAKKKALVAVANKILRQIFAVIKYQRQWTPYYHLKIQSV
jgi:transposase